MAERDPRYFKVYQDGDDRELEQKIQQIVESGAAPGIDVQAREEIEEIQRKIDSGEIGGGGGGGAGVDEQARQEIQEVNEKLADMPKYAKVQTPTNFSWKDHPLKDKILKSEKDYMCMYDVAVNKIKTGRTYYVNQSTGNDSNDGLTPATAFKSMKQAHKKGDISEMVLCNRTVNWDYSMGDTPIEKSIIIRGILGSKPLITNHTYAGWTKVSGYNNVYTRTATAPATVINTIKFNEYDDIFELTKVKSIAECEGKEDSFFIDGSNVYAHMQGHGSPGTEVMVIRNDKNSLTTTVSGSNFVYLDNVEVLGGFHHTGTGNIYAKNCKFLYGKLKNSFTNDLGFSILQDCVGAYAIDDGFSYSQAKGIEINCIGRYNGDDDNSTDNDNGSTAHGRCKIIRINGEYCYNHGPNIVDVQTDTESWNIGCVAHHSLAIEPNQKADFQSVDGNPKMFVEGCKGYASRYTLFTKDNAKMYVKDSVIESFNAFSTTSTIEEF